MSYIKRNVNIFLLLLVIIILGTLAGLTTYYQTTYKNLSISYGEKLNQLNELNYNLTAAKAQLAQLNEDLKVKSEVNKQFDVLYANISQYNDRLSTNYQTTKTELIDYISKLKKSDTDLASTKEQLEVARTDLKHEMNYSAKLDIEIKSLKSDICGLKTRLNETC